MKMEDQIASPWLCIKIPEGNFADSALVWACAKGAPKTEDPDDPKKWSIKFRTAVTPEEDCIPAPTVQEIMVQLDESGYAFPTCYLQGTMWVVACEDADHGMPAPAILGEESGYFNPGTGALRLWFEAMRLLED